MNKPLTRLASAAASVLTTVLLFNGVASLAEPKAEKTTELAALDHSSAKSTILVAQRPDPSRHEVAMP